jgi:hypothetical protein
MSMHTQNVFFIYDVSKGSVVLDDDNLPLVYLNRESVAIAAIEKFGKKALEDGRFRVKYTGARSYAGDETSSLKEVEVSTKPSRHASSEDDSDSRRGTKLLGRGKRK